MRLAMLAGLLALTPSAALARHSVSLDLGVGRAEQPTGSDSAAPTEPSYNFSTTLGGTLEAVEDRLEFDLSLSVLKDEGGTPSYAVSAGGEFTPDDHWSVSLAALYTPPRSADYQGTSALVLRQTGRSTEVATRYQTQDWSAGAALTGGYDTFGESNFETAVELSLGWTHFAIHEDLSYGPVITSLLEAAGQDATPTIDGALNQFKLAASVTETFFQDTDLTLRFSYYLYAEPPAKVGYARVVRPRTAIVAGAGLPIAPLRWELRPGITQRFTPWLSATLGGSVGGYEDEGRFAGANLKLSVKPTRFLKVSVGFSAQRDVDPPGAPALWSFYGGLGGVWYF